MKKLLATVMCLIVLAGAAAPAGAQTRYGRKDVRRAAVERGQYDDDNRYRERSRSVWQKHRDKITTAGGAVGGAVLGGLLGGKKGAVIGAVTGGAGAAVYTYKVRDRSGRY